MKNIVLKFRQSFRVLIILGVITLVSPLHGASFTEKEGEKLYRELCASCHMPDGKGAVGAGMYPSFIHNEKIANKAYPQVVVLYGLNGMPALGGVLDDEQIANVINYVRSHFGEYQDDLVTPQEISHLRIADYEYNDLD